VRWISRVTLACGDSDGSSSTGAGAAAGSAESASAAEQPTRSTQPVGMTAAVALRAVKLTTSARGGPSRARRTRAITCVTLFVREKSEFLR
jgi:hypothetical protein